MKNCLLSALLLVFISCSNSESNSSNKPADSLSASGKKTDSSKQNRTIADATTIMARPQIPVLCYHHIIDAAKATREYDVTINQFKAQMKILSDSGYHAILPEQLYNYLAYGDALPSKPVMLTFDDTDIEQFTVAKPEMDKYNFKGVYFIMTISIGRPRYMSKEQIKQLSDEGHSIQSHTWRHDRVDKYLTTPHPDRDLKIVNNDWDLQLGDKRRELEKITGKEIHYFAYPYGIWSKAGIPELRNRGFKLAFQLSTVRDPEEPLYTVRRIIVPPSWTPEGMLRVMKTSFSRG